MLGIVVFICLFAVKIYLKNIEEEDGFFVQCIIGEGDKKSLL